jgi:hypothetical protein
MSHMLPSPLALLDRGFLRFVQKFVPRAEREEWLRSWQAELWHMHHVTQIRRTGALRLTIDLPIGIVLDAFWLRTNSWRRTFSGTSILCIISLQALCLLSAFMALVLYGSWHALGLHLSAQAEHCLVAVPLLLFVGSAIASSSHIEPGSISRPFFWMNRQLFFALKTSLVLLLAFLLSSDVSRPIYAPLPHGADLFQIFFFILFALVGLRWSFQDQQQRCKQCLRSLTTPARVGRPSHNLLEWTGTEQVCRHGHGLLTVPEMESSWCQYSRWIDQESGWDEVASI